MIVQDRNKIELIGTSLMWTYSHERFTETRETMEVSILNHRLNYGQYPMTTVEYYAEDMEDKGIVKIFNRYFPMTRRQFEAIAEYPVWFFLTTVRGVWE